MTTALEPYEVGAIGLQSCPMATLAPAAEGGWIERRGAAETSATSSCGYTASGNYEQTSDIAPKWRPGDEVSGAVRLWREQWRLEGYRRAEQRRVR